MLFWGSVIRPGNAYSFRAYVRFYTHSTFVENVAGFSGGSIAVVDNVDIDVINSYIRNSSANYQGGGVFISNSARLSINNSIIEFNRVAENSGGGLHVSALSILNISNSNISYNMAKYHAGGIYLENSSASDTPLIVPSSNIARIHFSEVCTRKAEFSQKELPSVSRVTKY